VLWNYIYEELLETADRDTWTHIGEPWLTGLKNVHVYFSHRPADEFDAKFEDTVNAVKGVFMRGGHVLIYGWLQHVLRLRAIPDFGKRIDKILVGRRIEWLHRRSSPLWVRTKKPRPFARRWRT
jgi:hypothetical protein